AVGQFNLESRLSSDNLRTNEAASITMILTGTGNIKYAKCPAPILPVDFEQYTPSEDVRTHVSGNTVSGTVTAEYTFVPQSVGTFEIPVTEFTYFDPAKKDYVILNVGGYTLDVARGAATTVGVTEQSEIKQRATDILHIHRLDESKLIPEISKPAIYKVGFWIAWLGVIALAATGLALYHRHLKLQADVVGRKTARAGRVAKKRLRLAKGFMDKDQKQQFFAEILNALWGYISDRLVIPVSDLTRANISEKLSERGLAATDIETIINILDECEMARYTPDASLRSMQEIYDETSASMDALESMKKK
ncbi:MAG: BatD family protein, partial [Muribaculaceae bacterium]|nr:BatD family protein [Muribaculaceae bacterium]